MARILFYNKLANLSNLGKLSKEKGPVAERTMPVCISLSIKTSQSRRIYSRHSTSEVIH